MGALALIAAGALAACHANGVTPELAGGAPQGATALQTAGSQPSNKPVTIFRGIGSDLGGIAYGPHGDLYVADNNASIKRISPGGTTSLVRTTIVATAVAVDSSGNVFASQTFSGPSGRGIIEKIAPDGTIVRIGGRRWNPVGLATDAAGNLYVAHRGGIDKVDPSGKISVVGRAFPNPAGVAVDRAGNVYVANPDRHSIQKVSPAGTITAIGHGLSNPRSLAVDAAANVYVTTNSIPLAKISAGGAVSRVQCGLALPSAVAVDASGNLAVARSNPSRIVTVSTGGTVANLSLGTPYAVAASANGSVYVAAPGDDNVYRIFPNGRIVTVGSGFYQPQAVAADAEGNVYVGDFHERLYRISSSGKTTLLDSNVVVQALALDQKNNVYVASLQGVRRIGRDGKLVDTRANGFGDILGLAIDAKENFYIASGLNGLAKLAPNGSLTTIVSEPTESLALDKRGTIYASITGEVTIIAPGGKAHTFGYPFSQATGVAVDRAANLYVADRISGLVQKFAYVP